MNTTNERYKLNKELAQMLKGGVIMDVTTPEQARIADAWDADTLSQSDYDDIEPFSLRLTYYLKDGSQLSRSYSLYLRRGDLTVPSSATARVNALYMCRESVLRRVLGYGYEYLGDTPRFLDSYCYYYDENSNTKDYALTAAQAEQIYAALMQQYDVVIFNLISLLFDVLILYAILRFGKKIAE